MLETHLAAQQMPARFGFVFSFPIKQTLSALVRFCVSRFTDHLTPMRRGRNLFGEQLSEPDRSPNGKLHLNATSETSSSILQQNQKQRKGKSV